jgi:hypothetical protein
VRYVRPINYRLNPRQEISLLDAVVEARTASRYTFVEEEALADVWASGEDVRLREDSRFWEIEGIKHFQLAQHSLANEILADHLWQGIWDGVDIESALQRLDKSDEGSFHVFCPADPRFVQQDEQWSLEACPTVSFPETVQVALDRLTGDLLSYHRQGGSPLNTRQFIELLLRLKEDLPLEADDIERVESWLCGRREWSEIARGLWTPTDMVPTLPTPQLLSVWRIQGGSNNREVTAERVQIVETAGDEASEPGECIVRLPDPPVERHPDSAVSWTHVLRTTHILGNYLPVPTGARFRYPRFVGQSGAVAISGLSYDTGREGFLWLDREHHRFFGDLLREIIEWEEAGRRLLVNWRPAGVVIRLGEVDHEVQQEEQRHIAPQALHELRFGHGESYRQVLVSILQQRASGMNFKALYEELVKLQGHHPSRSSIRAVLTQSPEFLFKDSAWHWRAIPEAAEIFRRRVVWGSISAHSREHLQDLGLLADEIGKTLRELLNQQ